MRSGTGPRQAGGAYAQLPRTADTGKVQMWNRAWSLHHDAATAKLRRSDQELVPDSDLASLVTYVAGKSRDKIDARCASEGSGNGRGGRSAVLPSLRSARFSCATCHFQENWRIACKCCQTLSPMPAREAPTQWPAYREYRVPWDGAPPDRLHQADALAGPQYLSDAVVALESICRSRRRGA
jgi:hypothetical protein